MIKQSQKVQTGSVGLQVAGDLVVNVTANYNGSQNTKPSNGFTDDSWVCLPSIGNRFQKYKQSIVLLSEIDEYEKAKALYWDVLFYTGYNELWSDRIGISKTIYDMSIANRDYVNAGLVLCRGVSYPLLELSRHDGAVKILKKSYNIFRKHHDGKGVASCLSRYAEILTRGKRIAKAGKCFKKAIAKSRSGSIEEYQIRLKQEFTLYEYSCSSVSRRLDFLYKIQEKFSAIKDFREGLVYVEIGKCYAQIGELSRAKRHLENAIIFFTHKIHMPRHVRTARFLLDKLG